MGKSMSKRVQNGQKKIKIWTKNKIWPRKDMGKEKIWPERVSEVSSTVWPIKTHMANEYLTFTKYSQLCQFLSTIELGQEFKTKRTRMWPK